MQVTKVLGLAAVGALLVLAAPTERAQALSISAPAPRRWFSRIPGRRPRKWDGGMPSFVDSGP